MTRRRLGAVAAAVAAGLVAAAPAGAAPIVTVDSPPVGCCTGSKRPAITGMAATGGAVSPVTVQLFQGPAVDDTPEFTLTAAPDAVGRYSATPSIHLADGPWTARASQSDATGEGVSEPLTFVIDTVQPAPVITAPASGVALPTATPTITGRAGTAPGDNATVALFFTGPSGDFTLMAPVGADGAFSLTTPALPDGNYGVTAAQQDVAGNGASSVEVGFTIDTRKPNGVIEGGPVPVGGDPRSVQVSFGANELSTYRCELDGKAIAACEPPLLILRDLAPGPHELAITAVDPAGNVDPTPARLAFAIAVPKVALPPGALVVRGGETRLALRCPTSRAAGPCSGQVVLRRGGRILSVKAATFRIRPGRTARVRLFLNFTGERLLFQHGRLAIQVRIVAADGRGNVGRKTVRRTLVLPR